MLEVKFQILNVGDGESGRQKAFEFLVRLISAESVSLLRMDLQQ